MIPSGIGFIDESWKAAAEFERSMLRLQATVSTPPSREVVLQTYRRDASDLTPAEIADPLAG